MNDDINSDCCKRGNKVGQIGIEAVIVIAFVLALMIPIFHILYVRSSELREELRLLQAKRAIDSLAASINVVGVIGPSSSAIIEIDFPEGITAITINGREIVLTAVGALGPVDIPTSVLYNTSGTLTPSAGKKRIKITYDEETKNIILSEK